MISMLNEQASCNNMLCDAKDILEYIHCKKQAIFTLVSGKTGMRYTYRVERDNKGRPTYILSLLTGDDNIASYTRIGRIYPNGYNQNSETDDVYMFSQKNYGSSMPKSEKAAVLLLTEPELYLKLGGEFWAPARCRVCGRLLTTPGAIAEGIGHKCKAKEA